MLKHVRNNADMLNQAPEDDVLQTSQALAEVVDEVDDESRGTGRDWPKRQRCNVAIEMEPNT